MEQDEKAFEQEQKKVHLKKQKINLKKDVQDLDTLNHMSSDSNSISLENKIRDDKVQEQYKKLI